MTKGWIGVDLDRTLARHADGTGAPVPGAPIGPMVRRVKRWLAAGHDVRIFTARVQDQADPAAPSPDPAMCWGQSNNWQRSLIAAWCVEHLGQVLPITNSKDMHLWVLFDDRAVHIQPNGGYWFDPFSVPEELR